MHTSHILKCIHLEQEALLQQELDMLAGGHRTLPSEIVLQWHRSEPGAPPDHVQQQDCIRLTNIGFFSLGTS